MLISPSGGSPLLWVAVRDRRTDLPLLIGHRGVMGVAPENTLAGVDSACALDLSGVEVDVRFTRDSIPVLLHDETVDRTSNGTGAVSTLTLTQVKGLDFGTRFSSRFAGERIPTLREFFQRASPCGLRHLQLDIKTFSPVGAQEGWQIIRAEVERAGVLDRVVAGYPDVGTLVVGQLVMPGLRTMLLGVGPDSTIARLVLQGGIPAVGLVYDDYREFSSMLIGLHAVGVQVGVYDLSDPRQVNSLTPPPDFVATDWAWRRACCALPH